MDRGRGRALKRAALTRKRVSLAEPVPMWRIPFLRAYADPGSPTYGNMRQSCKAVGCGHSSTVRWWQRTRTDPRRSEYLRQVMDDNGLSDDFLFARNRDLIQSHDGADVAAGLRLAYQVKGHIKPAATVQTLIVSLGCADEGELRRIVERHRALSGYSLDDAERDGLEALRLVLRERPERAGEIRSRLFSEREVEEVQPGGTA